MIEEMQRLIDNVSRNFPKATETELIILKGKYEAFMEYIKEQPVADVQPVRKWVNDNICSPSVDGDYLVFYRGFFHVFERFKGKWYDEDRCDVITDLDKLWWQELPPMPETIKG